MSSILEALKKLEDEKAARRGGIGNIAARLASPRRSRQSNARLVAAAMVAVALIAVLATYAAMGGFESRTAASSAGASTAPPAMAPSVPSTVPTTSTAGPANNAKPSSTPSGPNPATLAAESPRARAEAPSGQEAPPSHPGPSARTAPRPAGDKEPPLDQFPALNVSGIAWEKDEASRIAVVNGTSVAEGSVIEGAIVREILPDRVRFSFNQKEFDVSMGKGIPINRIGRTN